MPATRGKNIRLSIDNRLQDYVTQRMSSVESGAVVVMDVHSGEVVSMVSTPDFDPNKFVRGIEQSQWDNLLNNPYKPLINKAISGLYAPASTFKPVVTLACFRKWFIAPYQTFLFRFYPLWAAQILLLGKMGA